ncbi:hypothetical protein IZY60_09250 [Lutibacter sp. B2]|nr:hypothetical protein [Lutibacter sp. B2]
MSLAKQMGLILRFIYGYLKGFIFISVIYITVGLTIIMVNPYEFSLVVIKYIRTPEYDNLYITYLGYLFMILWGFKEVANLKKENKRKRKKRRKKNE